MMSSKRLAVAITGAVAALALSACASVGATTTAQPVTPSPAMPTDGVTPEPTDGVTPEPTGGGTEGATPEPTGTSTSAPADAAFGPECSSLPTDPNDPGSLEAMAQQPVGDALAGNPMLSTVAAAISQAGLADTLNGMQDITVFAPTNEAFGKIPAADLDAILADPNMLQEVLSYHVVPGTLTQENLPGTHATVQGGDITVTGSGADFMVNDSATVLCGNIKTQNATVYLIDGVLMPS